MLPLTPTIHRLVHEPPRVRPVPDAQVLATSPARRPRLWGTVAHLPLSSSAVAPSTQSARSRPAPAAEESLS